MRLPQQTTLRYANSMLLTVPETKNFWSDSAFRKGGSNLMEHSDSLCEILSIFELLQGKAQDVPLLYSILAAVVSEVSSNQFFNKMNIILGLDLMRFSVKRFEQRLLHLALYTKFTFIFIIVILIIRKYTSISPFLIERVSFIILRDYQQYLG